MEVQLRQIRRRPDTGQEGVVVAGRFPGPCSLTADEGGWWQVYWRGASPAEEHVGNHSDGFLQEECPLVGCCSRADLVKYKFKAGGK